MFKFQVCCWMCAQPLMIASHGICSFCYLKVNSVSWRCPRCAYPVLHPYSKCQFCLPQSFPWQHLITVANYETPVKQWVQQFKYQGKTVLATMLARLMLLAWLDARRCYLIDKPDLILSVPMYRFNRWRRGYNQAEMLALKLSKWLNIPCELNTLRKIRRTSSQQSLRAELRRFNLTNSFSCQRSIANKHILLIDDIVTTGATALEISHLLKKNGAGSIYILCLCRTL